MMRSFVNASVAGFSLVFGAALAAPDRHLPTPTPADQFRADQPPAPGPAEPASAPEPAAPAPAIDPETLGPVSVAFQDPDRTVAICGERVNLDLIVRGPKKNFDWKVLPPGVVGFKRAKDGSSADFTTRFPGQYTFLVAVGGADGSVAQAYKVVEMRQDVAPQPSSMPSLAASGRLSASETAGSHEMPLDMGPPNVGPPSAVSEASPQQLIAGYTAAVRSPAKVAEIAQIRTALVLVAARIEAGELPIPAGTADFVGYLSRANREQAALTLAASYPAWARWFAHVEALYQDMAAKGAIRGPANFAAANRSTAAVLEAAH